MLKQRPTAIGCLYKYRSGNYENPAAEKQYEYGRWGNTGFLELEKRFSSLIFQQAVGPTIGEIGNSGKRLEIRGAGN